MNTQGGQDTNEGIRSGAGGTAQGGEAVRQRQRLLLGLSERHLKLVLQAFSKEEQHTLDAPSTGPGDAPAPPQTEGGGGSGGGCTGACGYNRPCAHQYVGIYQSCMVENGRLIPHASYS